MAILVSGGAGYIGSHTCIELLNAGYDVVVADNYYNASPVVLDRIKQITGKDFRFYKADMTKHEDVERIFSECPDITAVIQFAAYKAVGESVSKPIEYYYNNLNCTLVILDVMRHHNCHNFVFSSSATVYGDPASLTSVTSTPGIRPISRKCWRSAPLPPTVSTTALFPICNSFNVIRSTFSFYPLSTCVSLC